MPAKLKIERTMEFFRRIKYASFEIRETEESTELKDGNNNI